MKHALLSLLSFSAVLLTGCETGTSVVVQAPIEKVWEYVSDSTRAAEWSVFFDHISPLPGIQDGKVGSKRRCFRKADETGMFWDEETIEVKPPTYRQIHTFNIHGFANPILNTGEYKVHQRLESLGPEQTRLTFASGVWKLPSLRLLIELFRDREEARRMLHVNLENIKAAIEARYQGRPYVRIHPYEPKDIWKTEEAK